MFDIFQVSRNFWSNYHNFHEDEKNIYIEFEIPGVKKEDLEAFIRNDELIIQGKRLIYGSKEYEYILSNAVVISDNIDIDHIDIFLKNGILIITLPKLQSESLKYKKIAIRVD